MIRQRKINTNNTIVTASHTCSLITITGVPVLVTSEKPIEYDPVCSELMPEIFRNEAILDLMFDRNTCEWKDHDL